MTAPDTTRIVLAEDQAGLLAWAEGERGPDFAEQLGAAIVGARDAGWDWDRIAPMAARLVTSGHAHEMTDAVRTFRRDQQHPPANPHAWADKARRDLERARAERAAAGNGSDPR